MRQILKMIQGDNQRVAAIRKRSRRSDSAIILLFLIPCLQIVQLHVIGVLYGSDLLLLATFIVLALRGRIRVTAPVGKWFLILGCLWLASQCVTDILRHSAFADYVRGWSNIGMTLVNFCVLWTLLYGKTRRLIVYGWGLVAGSLLTYLIKPDDFAQSYPWKFGLAYPVTMGVVLIASSKRFSGLWPIIVTAAIGAINVSLGARNRGGACVAAALYLLLTLFLRGKLRESTKVKAGTVVTLAASIVLGVVGIFWGYEYAANVGMLGLKAQKEYEQESSGKYGLLLGGRSELLGSIPAIYDSPILGHGSWARDPKYILMQITAENVFGYKGGSDITRADLEEGLIPAHSYLFQAWVDAGIVGALFWGWVFVFTAKTLMRVYPATVVLLPAASFIAFSLLWDILFSPYGATGRIVVPYYIVLLATCLAMAPQQTARAAIGVAK